ncbi:C2H2-type domain-containing protein [Plasmodiophora brassicae]
MENLRPWPGAFCKLLLVHPRATLTMELWKLFALVFAFLAGRCALGADDDVDSDVARTRDFDLNMAWDAHRDPHHGMTSNAGTNDIGNLGDEVAMSTAALGRGRVPASYAIGHQLSGIPNWAPANVVRCMPDFGRQDSVADSQHQPTTYNVGAGATISWTAAKDTPDTCIHCGNQLPRFSCTHCGKRLSSAFSLRRHLTTHYKQQQNTMSNVDAGASTSASVPDNTHVTGIHCRKKVSHQVTCVDCGKQVLGRSLARHQKRSCPALLLRKSYCPHCRHQAEFSRPDTMGRS